MQTLQLFAVQLFLGADFGKGMQRSACQQKNGFFGEKGGGIQ